MPKVLSYDPEKTEFKIRPVKNIKLFVSENAMNDMIYHSESGHGKEVMGLMVGRVYKDDEGIYVTADRIVSSELISDAVSVRFDKENMELLFDSIDDMKDGELVTGWYHSHPGYGCFMSEMDSKTHIGAFGDDRSAVVVDPVRKEIKAFGSTDGAVHEIQFVLMED